MVLRRLQRSSSSLGAVAWKDVNATPLPSATSKLDEEEWLSAHTWKKIAVVATL